MAQHGVQDAAVAIVIDLNRRINATNSLERRQAAVNTLHLDNDRLPGLQLVVKIDCREDLRAVQLVRLGAFARFILQREDTHPDQIAAMNAFKALSDYKANSQ